MLNYEKMMDNIRLKNSLMDNKCVLEKSRIRWETGSGIQEQLGLKIVELVSKYKVKEVESAIKGNYLV